MYVFCQQVTSQLGQGLSPPPRGCWATENYTASWALIDSKQPLYQNLISSDKLTCNKMHNLSLTIWVQLPSKLSNISISFNHFLISVTINQLVVLIPFTSASEEISPDSVLCECRSCQAGPSSKAKGPWAPPTLLSGIHSTPALGVTGWQDQETVQGKKAGLGTRGSGQRPWVFK